MIVILYILIAITGLKVIANLLVPLELYQMGKRGKPGESMSFVIPIELVSLGLAVLCANIANSPHNLLSPWTVALAGLGIITLSYIWMAVGISIVLRLFR